MISYLYGIIQFGGQTGLVPVYEVNLWKIETETKLLNKL